jgi:hypothetical protein
MSEKTISIEAQVAAKQGVYDETVPEMDPHGDPLFEAAFETDKGVVIVWMNSYDYYRLEVGMKGTLVYSGDQLISFEPWIKASFPV